MAMSKKKICLIICVIAVLVVSFVIVDRKFQLLPIGYEGLNLESDYRKIRCEYYNDYYSSENEEDIRLYIEQLNNVKIREVDWLDNIVNSSPFSGKDGSEVRNIIILTLSDGTQDNISFDGSGDGRLYYGGKTYVIKGHLSDKLMNLAVTK